MTRNLMESRKPVTAAAQHLVLMLRDGGVCCSSISEEQGEGCPGARAHLSACTPEPWGGRDGATGKQGGGRAALLPNQLQEGKWGSREGKHQRSARVNTGNLLSKRTHLTHSTVS